MTVKGRALKMRQVGALMIAFTLVACAGGMPDPEPVPLHDRLLTLDSHVDIPLTYMTPAADPGVRGPMQVDLPKMIDGGLDAAFFIVFVPQGPLDQTHYAAAYDTALIRFNAIDRMVARYNDRIALARTPDDLERIVVSGRLAAMIGVENAYPLGTDLSRLQDFYDRGTRYISLTHGGDNQFATSSTGTTNLGVPANPTTGLTDLGRQAVAEMNRLGIMVDVSHASRPTTLELVEASTAPVIASHSSVKGMADVPRNLTDEELKAIAATGGVVQIVAFDTYLTAPTPERREAIRAARAEMGFTSVADLRAASQEDLAALRTHIAGLDGPRSSVSDLVDHIDYAVALIGIDHVGISSDFGGGGGIAGWDDASETANVTAELTRRGYSQADIAKLWSGNLIRVWRAVEAAREP